MAARNNVRSLPSRSAVFRLDHPGVEMQKMREMVPNHDRNSNGRFRVAIVKMGSAHEITRQGRPVTWTNRNRTDNRIDPKNG